MPKSTSLSRSGSRSVSRSSTPSVMYLITVSSLVQSSKRIAYPTCHNIRHVALSIHNTALNVHCFRVLLTFVLLRVACQARDKRAARLTSRRDPIPSVAHSWGTANIQYGWRSRQCMLLRRRGKHLRDLGPHTTSSGKDAGSDETSPKKSPKVPNCLIKPSTELKHPFEYGSRASAGCRV
eukprot:1196356-Prorocentrum_minimum.AAC.5